LQAVRKENRKIMAETCEYQAQIDGQTDAIADLEQQKLDTQNNSDLSTPVKARIIATLDAQISVRQDIVNDLTAKCAE
jgi:uncharacterized membrane protein YcjF (UPF0283 family)